MIGGMGRWQFESEPQRRILVIGENVRRRKKDTILVKINLREKPQRWQHHFREDYAGHSTDILNQPHYFQTPVKNQNTLHKGLGENRSANFDSDTSYR